MLLLSNLLEEYRYHCLAKGFTKKTMANKKQELGQLPTYLLEKRRITEMESITVHDFRAYFRQKQKEGLQPQSIVAMMKLISAFFNWCVKEEYLTENPMKRVETPKVARQVYNGFTSDEVVKMVEAFSYKTYLEVRNKALITPSRSFRYFHDATLS